MIDRIEGNCYVRGDIEDDMRGGGCMVYSVGIKE